MLKVKEALEAQRIQITDLALADVLGMSLTISYQKGKEEAWSKPLADAKLKLQVQEEIAIIKQKKDRLWWAKRLYFAITLRLFKKIA